MFNFGKATPTEETTNNDRVGQAGLLMGDVGALFKGHGGGVGGFLGNTMLGVSEMRDGNYFAGASNVVGGMLNGVQAISPRLAASMPGLGVAAGAANMIGYGAEAARHIDQIDGGYQNNEFWQNAGWSTIGGLNAAAALDPTGISSLYVGGGTLALDGIGALAGWINPEWGFDAGSAVGAAEHLVFDTGQAIGQGAMWAGEHIADGASAAWSGAKNLASNVGTGVGNAARNVWHGAGNLANRAGGALSRGANAVSNAASNVGHGISNAATNVWNGASNVASRATNAVSNVANRATSAVSNAASNTWNAVADW